MKDQKDMYTEPENLDCMDTSELETLAVKNIYHDPIEGAYIIYARALLLARLYRTKGQIARAMQCEDRCDTQYAKLPPSARW